ncbi:MAG TPA: hemolysin III family protein [Gemmatimonadaceae bacterium]
MLTSVTRPAAEPDESLREELWNALTHGVGAFASLTGGTALITMAAMFGGSRQVVGASVFSATLVLLYVASTLYHAIPHAAIKARLEVLDHCAIYLLIAGTYTPFTLVSLRGAWGWTLFGLVWGLAALGVIFKLFFTGRFKFVSTVLYVALGWMVLIAWRPMVQAVSPATLRWLLAGGVMYTVGTVFYMNRKIRYSHGIWHLFVLSGSVLHFVAVMEVVR